MNITQKITMVNNRKSEEETVTMHIPNFPVEYMEMFKFICQEEERTQKATMKRIIEKAYQDRYAEDES